MHDTTPSSPSADPRENEKPLLILAGVSFVWLGLCLLLLRRLWKPDLDDPASGLVWELAATLPLAPWIVWLLRHPRRRLSVEGWYAIFAAAFFLRLILFAQPPMQSDDLYRYVWEGRIQLHGINPYVVPPDSQQLWPLRYDPWYEINHRDLPAIYPPLAQWCFILPSIPSSRGHNNTVLMKYLFILLELSALWVFGNWLECVGRSRAWAALWVFHPLMIVEFSGNGHLDSLMILTLIGSLLLLEKSEIQNPKSETNSNDPDSKSEIFRLLGSIVLLAMAILAKVIPVLIAPFYVWRLGRRWWWLALVPLLILLAYLPYLGDGPRAIFHSSNTYAWNWSGNGPAFEFLRRFADGDGWQARRWLWRGMAALIAALWFLRWEPRRAALPVLGAWTVLGPIVHPWYLTLLLPLAIFDAARRERAGTLPAWLWLTAVVPLDYLRQAELAAEVAEPTIGWTAWVIWLPFWLLLAWGLIPARTQRP